MKRSILALLVVFVASHSFAADFFLTIGGGYAREGNQASLEANVQFLQDILREEYADPPTHTIFFSDGDDRGADLQVAADAPELTAEQLIASLHSRSRGRVGTPVRYRNHNVSGVAGSTIPENIKAGLQRIAESLVSGDRLFVFVTAHGSAAKGENEFDTTIDCWGRKSISAGELSRWLDDVPADVPVILVMAQCFCGGFAHAVFDGADSSAGISDHLRTGFFAQQHNLAAAGCRPDIDNDEEYSSFFWGALVGRSRTGKPIDNVDLNDDGVISFAEAHAHAVLASNTIDIPLRASESLLRELSRKKIAGIANLDRQTSEGKDDRESNDASSEQPSDDLVDQLRNTAGSLLDLTAQARPDVRGLVAGLVSQLGMRMEDQIADVIDAWEERKQEFRSARRSTFRGGSQRGSGRNELREEIFFVWPELADGETWRESDLLNKKNREGLLAEIKLLPSYSLYQQAQQERKQASAVAENAELAQIKFRRLVETLVSVALARNLAEIASDEVIDRYQKMLAIEESALRH